ncbi:MAG: Gfo/Idh/MocA family oxidoreductase [Bacteriovoracaceae bacterium]|nr:Gfo/Idh/MocA family oxidoreductase [Bacteriovoracaceae bacterium]
MSKVKVAVIGCGYLGKWHLEKAMTLANAEVIAAVDPSSEIRKEMKSRYPGLKTTADIEEVIDEIEAGIVVTPTSHHFEIVKKLIENDKHVFCEKPLTSNKVDAIALKDLLKTKQLVVQIGHSERCHQIWERKDLYGDFLDGAAHARIKRYAPFKGRATDVDVVQDLMIHDLDLLYMLWNEMPIRISTSGYKIMTDHWDHVHAELEYPSGRRAAVTVGRAHVEEKRMVELVNDNGVCQVDLMNLELRKSKSGSEVEVFKYEKRDHLLIEQTAFYSSILEKHPIMVNIEDGLNAVEMISDVLESLKSGKSIVKE